MEVNRQDLLKKLQLVGAGLSSRGLVEQTSCFAFKDKRIHTYNDEVYCHTGCVLPLSGVVESVGLLGILSKLKQERLDIEQVKDELLLRGSGFRTGLVMEQELQLPLDSIQPPEKWLPLAANFSEAINLVWTCAAKDETRFDLACVHIHPNWLESCDDSQMMRYTVKTKLKQPVLVRAASVRQLAPLGVTEFGITDAWIHFRNTDEDLVYAVRKYEEPYPDLTSFYDVAGESLTFPGAMSEKIEKASHFSSDSTNEVNQILVQLRNGKMRIKGSGSYGWHIENCNVTYTGPAISFFVSPKLLHDFSAKANECVVNPQRLLVNGTNYRWLGCLIANSED